MSDLKRVDIPDSYAGDSFTINIAMVRMKIGKKVVLKNIFFESGKSVLTPASGAELDHLYDIMDENPKMKIEISGHTDKIGNEPANFKLSESRALAVVQYLVDKGIEKSRLEYTGFGSLQPVADNATPAGRAKNRRVEFKILGF